MVDRIILAAHVPSGGAYTAVGTYDHGEMWSLVAALSKATETPGAGSAAGLRPASVRPLRRRLSAFLRRCRVARSTSSRDLNSMIHVEVRKLYPDAELPHFEVLERSASRMVLLYQSARHFADLAEGLIQGCAEHFREPLAIRRESVAADSGSRVRFTLERA